VTISSRSWARVDPDYDARVERIVELGPGLFALRYRFYDQQIGVVVGSDGVLVIDTRSTHRQADELRADIGRLTPLPVTVVVNTHGH